MSRRLIFLVTAFVVVLYFSVILFILKPLHGRSGINGGYMNGFAFREIPALNWCKPLRWQSPPGKTIALVSFPGSGNTWLRYLLQQATGILTGSIYMDYGLRTHGFPAENVTDGSVLVVKTHGNPPSEPGKFHAAVMLVRDPGDAILADFNRLHKGHIGTAPKSAFKVKRDGKNTDWSVHVNSSLAAWERLAAGWLAGCPARAGGGAGSPAGGGAGSPAGVVAGCPLLVVQYEDLVRDTRGTLLTILEFLNHTVSEEAMQCAMERREGIYRRRRRAAALQPYSAQQRAALDSARRRVRGLFKEHGVG